jgi:PAS domain S-box-containing protein
MKEKKETSSRSRRKTLRKRAEETLRTMSHRKEAAEKDLLRIVHELEIHQVELKLQNEELRNAQVELAATRDRYTDLYEFAPLAYITLDKDGKVIESNFMAAGMLGVERRDLVRVNLTKFVTSESQDDWYLHRQAAFSAEGRQVCEIGIHRADGVLLSMRVESVAVGLGTERHCRTAFIDITDRKRAEAEREELLAREQAARREAEEAAKAKDRFLAMVSHELRTPLTPILGWSRILLSKKAKDVDVHEALESIERNAKIEAQLVNDLLDVSGSASGKMRLNLQSIDLTKIINSALDTVRTNADGKAIRIETRLDRNARLVSGDPERLQQVIWNLLTNAVKFTPNGGRIEIRLRRAAGGVEIGVSDTGPGIPASFLPYLFDPFSQADNARSQGQRGLGLGLAIVRQIVEMHGGTIGVASSEGQGSTFTIRLPARTDHRSEKYDPSEAADDSALDRPQFEGMRMLVVDDETDTLEMLKRVFDNTSAETRACGNVVDALEILRDWKADAVISDLDMPNQDGYMLIAEVRELERLHGGHAAAIALTAHVQVADRVRALSAGFDAFVPKPVVPNDLLEAVSGALHRPA